MDLAVGYAENLSLVVGKRDSTGESKNCNTDCRRT